jgi:pyrroloquinoline quinone biosynthesis protein E
MKSPCRECPQREVDFGGCRCQAFLLTGDAGNTDPACSRSPEHYLIQAALAEPSAQPLRLRSGRSLCGTAQEG